MENFVKQFLNKALKQIYIVAVGLILLDVVFT
jgi:hypothetical protein